MVGSRIPTPSANLFLSPVITLAWQTSKITSAHSTPWPTTGEKHQITLISLDHFPLPATAPHSQWPFHSPSSTLQPCSTSLTLSDDRAAYFPRQMEDNVHAPLLTSLLVVLPSAFPPIPAPVCDQSLQCTLLSSPCHPHVLTVLASCLLSAMIGKENPPQPHGSASHKARALLPYRAKSLE